MSVHSSWAEFPHLLAELDPNGNKDLTHRGKPVSVLELAAGTGKCLDWKCSTCGHKWSVSGSSRILKGGTGCPPCGIIKRANNQSFCEPEESIAHLYPDLLLDWDYDKNERSPDTFKPASNKKVYWRCQECDYEWKTSVAKRTSRGDGCARCAGRPAYTTESWIESVHAVHENAYDYSLVKYTNAKTNVIIRCIKHDEIFKQTPDSHSNGSTGCSQCIFEKSIQPIVSHEEWLRRFHEKHGDKYDYSKVGIIKANEKIEVICSDHGSFFPTAGNHSSKYVLSGCPECAMESGWGGFVVTQPAQYYVHKITSESGNLLYYKGGISGNWQRRLRDLRSGLPVHLTIENCEVISFEVGQEALDLENTLLRMAAEEGWKAPAQPFDGGSELFINNPLEEWRNRGEEE